MCNLVEGTMGNICVKLFLIWANGFSDGVKRGFLYF